MLFTAMVLMTVGYSMVYSALHGQWQFWTFWFPKNRAAATPATPAPQAAAA